MLLKEKYDLDTILLASGCVPEHSRADRTRLVTDLLVSNSRPLHNMVPLIVASSPDSIRITPELRAKYLSLIAVHVRQMAWLRHFIETLLPEDISIMVLKGHALIGSVYSNDHPRLSCDIDLLVRKKDFNRVCQLIEADSVVSRKTSMHLGFFIDLPYKVQVEIHSDIADRHAFNINFDAVWRNSKPHPMFHNERIRVMSVEDQFLHMLLHGFNHAQYEAYMIVDAIRICNQPEFDVNVLIAHAREMGCSRLLRGFVDGFDFVRYHQDFARVVREIPAQRWLMKAQVWYFQGNRIQHFSVRRQLLGFMFLDSCVNMSLSLIESIRVISRRIARWAFNLLH